MSRLLTRIYLIGVVLALVLIATFFFWRVSSVIATEEKLAAARFGMLSQEISKLWRDESVDRAARTASLRFGEAGTNGNPLVVSVYSFNDGIDYLWARSEQFLDYTPDTAPPVPRIRMNNLVHRRFSRSFQLPDGTQRIVTAVYTVLNKRNAYQVLRDTLSALLGVIAAILVIALVHSVRGAVLERRHRQRVGSSSIDDRDLGTDADSDSPPRLDLMPRDELNHRLSLELDRAGLHEQDITVVWFTFNNVTDGILAYRNAQMVLTFFTLADLCFDGGQHQGFQGVVVILPNTTLREGLAQAERFQHFYWHERATWKQDEVDFACGLTARNGRLVEAQRIIRECRAAVRRAETLPGKIMGFQPDPQRYREYLVGHSS